MQSQKIWWKGYLSLVNLSILFYSIDSGVIKAQITPDNTLPNNSVVTPSGEVQRITGGSQSEGNLFHSFKEFSVLTRGTAYFDNAINVENIISRVTGKSVSNIDGLIQANGAANVFLINPNGIIFGPNSRLNIGGSFIGSTASSVNFADGTSFSATNPQSPPLLKVSRPIGLSFESNSGTINVQGNGHELIRQSIGPGVSSPILGINNSAGLEVESGKTLALIGNNLILEGGILTSRGGRIELGSVEDGAVVGLTPTPFGGWSLEYDDSSELGNIQLAQRSFVGVYGTDSGTIRLRGANVSLDDASVILNQNQGSQPSGELSVNASESLRINGTSQEARLRSGLFSEATGVGKGGELTVLAKRVLVENGAGLGTTTYGPGAGGDLRVSASESIQIREVSPFDTTVLSGMTTSTLSLGDGGALTVSTNKLLVEGGGGIGTRTYRFGKGGDVTINAFEEAKVIGYSLLDPNAVANISSFTSGLANAGNINLFTQELLLKDGGRIGSSSFGSGTGGNVLVNADSIDVIGVVPRTFSPSVLDASTFASGDAGNLTINTSKLKVLDGGRVDTSTLASGNAGILEVNASDFIEVSGVVANSLNPSLIDSSASILDPILQELFELEDKPSGDAGSLTLNTRSLIVKNGAQITVKNDGTGNAGTLEINANSVRLENKAGITASTESGQGGNIKINSDDWLLMRRNSRISTNAGNAQAGGDGGQINIDTTFLVAPPLENSDITANAFSGKGGSVQILASAIFGFVPRSREELQTLLRIDNPNELDPSRLLSNDVTAISQTNPSLSGQVTFNTLDTGPRQALIDLPEQVVDVSALIAQGCSGSGNNVGRRTSEFIVTGRGGLPPQPGEPLQTEAKVVDNDTLETLKVQGSAVENTTVVTRSSPNKLVEAQGWVFDEQGEMMLTDQPLNATSDNSSLNQAICYAP